MMHIMLASVGVPHHGSLLEGVRLGVPHCLLHCQRIHAVHLGTMTVT